MGELLLLAFGVCCALLCHWIIRHTYVDWDWVTLEEPDEEGCRRKKVWNEKLQLPRWGYILIWLFCIVCFPLAIAAPMFTGIFIYLSDFKFIHNNKFISWLTKKV